MNPPTPAFANHLPTLSSSRREGLTAIFRKAQGRGVPEASGWLNPEHSLGPYLGRNKWTRDKFWEAIGPAREAFHEIAPKIKQYLEDTVEPISSRVTWSMYMVGRAPAQASPSIIFCGEVLFDRRHVREIIKESGILDDYPPGIKTGHLPRPPGFDQLVPLGARDRAPDGRSEMIALTAHDRSACGSQIFENSYGTSSVRLSAVATIGGVLRLGKTYYYMTAAHTILPGSDSTGGDEWPARDPTGSALSLDGNEDMCATSASHLSTDDLSLRQSPSRVSERSDENRYLRDDIVRQWSLEHHHEAEEPLSPLADPGQLSLVRTETPSFTSMVVDCQGFGLDYALIEMKSLHHSTENVIRFGPKHGKVIKVHSFARSVPRDLDILAITSRGTIKGRISATPVYSSAPGQRAYNRMFKVILGSPLQKGDCGTWVVGAATGHLFGHVVLGSPGGNIALLIPFADVFDDVLSRTGRSLVFPGARDDGSTTPAETRMPRNPRDVALARIIRKTIYSMSEMREVQSPRYDAISQAQSPETISSGHSSGNDAQIAKGPTDLSKSKGDLEGLRSGSTQNNTLRNVSLISLCAVHEESTSQASSDTSEKIGETSNGPGRLMDQKGLDPGQRTEKGPALSQPSSRSHSSLTRKSRREESLVMLTSQGPRSANSDQHDPKPLKAPVQGPKFRDVLLTFSKAPLQWENTELLQYALEEINLNAINNEGCEEAKEFMSYTRPGTRYSKPRWDYKDCVIRALSKYFREDFFTRIKKPSCGICSTELPTIARGHARPTPEEKAGKAQVVELYQCAEKHCQAYTRFPRYWDVGTLFKNPRGRAGEAANCFGMLCRALGARVRWVWTAEDRIWTEVYSEHQGRWVHVDACEGIWDKPLTYTEKMGKKLSYCIAFSVDGAVDVTARYVRSSSNALPRTQCSEEELLGILHEINSMRRAGISRENLARLEKEDTAEAKELVSYLAPSNTLEMAGHTQPADVKLDRAMRDASTSKEKEEVTQVTSATSYTGQEWNPLSHSWIEDDE